MPIQIQGKSYTLPGEGAEPSITGEELDAIEMHYKVEALDLIDGDFDAAAGRTHSRWLYSMAWLGLHRAGDERALADVAKLSVSEIVLQEQENPTDATSSVAESGHASAASSQS